MKKTKQEKTQRKESEGMEKTEEINKNTKRGLKNGSEKSSYRQLKNAKTESKKNLRQERKLFLKCSFNLREKVRKHLLVNCFKKW